MSAPLVKVGACLGVCKSGAEAIEQAGRWTAQGNYGNPGSEYEGFVVEPFTRSDGVVIYKVYAAIRSGRDLSAERAAKAQPSKSNVVPLPAKQGNVVRLREPGPDSTADELFDFLEGKANAERAGHKAVTYRVQQAATPTATPTTKTAALGDAARFATDRFELQTAEEFALNGSDLEYHIDGVIPRAGLVGIYGASGSGKTFITLDLAAAVSRGQPWRGRPVRQGRVVYVVAEGASGFKKRLRAYKSAFNVQWDDLPFVLGDAPDLAKVDDVKALAGRIKEVCSEGADLVVVDTLAAATPGTDENTGKDMGQVIEHCRTLHRQTGATVMLVHHSGKDATKGARGWSGLRAALDAELEVVRVGSGDDRVVKITKMKDGEDGLQFAFRLQQSNVLIPDGKVVTSCIVEHTDAPTTPAKQVEQPTGEYQPIVYAIVKKLAIGDSFNGVSVKDIKQAAKRKISHETDDTTACKKLWNNLDNAIRALARKNLVRYRDGLVSLPGAVPSELDDDDAPFEPRILTSPGTCVRPLMRSTASVCRPLIAAIEALQK